MVQLRAQHKRHAHVEPFLQKGRHLALRVHPPAQPGVAQRVVVAKRGARFARVPVPQEIGGQGHFVADAVQVGQRQQARGGDLGGGDVGGAGVARGEAGARFELGGKPEGFAAQGEGRGDGLKVVDACVLELGVWA